MIDNGNARGCQHGSPPGCSSDPAVCARCTPLLVERPLRTDDPTGLQALAASRFVDGPEGAYQVPYRERARRG
jgi:hypothetical protein